MSSIFFYLILAIGLSMDGFSLAVAYGSNGISKKKALFLSLLVGMFHFIMPNIGGLIGRGILHKFILYSNLITGIVFLYLTIQMILSLKEKDNKYQLGSIVEIVCFALAVSIDSFTLGIVLCIKHHNLLVAGFSFSIVSFLFTLLGLFLGKYLGEKTGKFSKIIGVIILFIFTIKYLFNL